ncbi:MAG TPA: M28 family peptidase [Gemmataceae bacterium]|nr:M28 family peptidase [Gemmataceae bacterium]
MALAGWKQLVDGIPWFVAAESYPIAAYSEFMPPPREVCKPYLGYEVSELDENDPWGWPVSEWEEARQLRPGLEHIAEVLVQGLVELAHGRPAHGFSRGKLAGNPAWPPLLIHKGILAHERYVTLLPLALSKTLDDKGRERWTLFGSSETGPARAFWRSFFITPRRQAPAELGESFIRRLLHTVYNIPLEELTDLRKAGFRILPMEKHLAWPHWREEPLPDWTTHYLWTKNQPLRSVRFLLTFRPFATLPDNIQQAYVSEQLHLLPCPASLLFWGVPSYHLLQHELPFAAHIPLQHVLPRREDLYGLRIPQSGWLHEPHPEEPPPDDPQLALKNTYLRTHRWAKLHRHEDELAVLEAKERHEREEKLVHVLFSTEEDDLGLYGKPMARNVQLWTRDHHLLLDGPRASRDDIRKAEKRVLEGGVFGYRFQFPPLRVGLHEIYWHRPLVAYLDHTQSKPAVLPDAPLGYLTAYRAEQPNLARPVELWPRLQHREPYLETLDLFQHVHDHHYRQTALNVRLLLDSWHLRGQQSLPRSLARQLLLPEAEHSLEAWLGSLPDRSLDPPRGQRLVETLERCLEPAAGETNPVPENRTFAFTTRRSFEVQYWKKIAFLSEGRFVTKCNADYVRDEPTRKLLDHLSRDLDPLGDYLLKYYRRILSRAGLGGKALVGELPFHWRTDFDFDWMDGWLKNQEQVLHERDLIVVIPGRDRSRAVIMADHYDTAYMADRYDPQYGGSGARLAAAGADDNHSATTALMQAAPIFLDMSRKKQLGCDVWLIHLTGEEFPADCLGARHLTQLLVEGRLKVRLENNRWRDLSKVRIQGVYVLDMVAHNNDKEPDVFQISPGTGRYSLWLAEQAHLANEAWNAACERLNQRRGRRGLGRGRRSPDGSHIPATAAHLPLRGEVRLPTNPRSTLYNTDGQIFSDAGVPVVLFMENYDINRTGYHDTHDTMANIDLDYGAAVTAIAIESVARAATEKPPEA